MYCPSCHDPNPYTAETCVSCGAHLPGHRRVYVGEQFVLLNADVEHPIAIGLDDGPPFTLSKPTIVSRYCHAVTFGDAPGDDGHGRPVLRRGRRRYVWPLPDVPRLDSPRLDLTAVVTERRVYRPHDEAHIFVVAPDHADGEVELEVCLAGQQIMREKLTLNAGGLALFPYADLEEGEYTVRVRRNERGEWAECGFSVAEFTLSPLIATLESRSYAQGVLHYQLCVRQLSVLYTGPVSVNLQCAVCGGRVVQSQELHVQAGVAAGTFDLSRHGGPFKLQVITPQGETATVDLPGSGAGERERITINPLGRVAEASLLPGDATQPVRGLYVGYGDYKAAPLRLESAIGREAHFEALGDYAVVQIIAHNPLSGETALHEWRDVRRRERLSLEVNPPFTLFTVAVATATGLHESWSVVIRPPDLEATLTAPAQAAPGDDIRVTLCTTASPHLPASVYCLLLAYDARLEHESPLPKLGRRQYQAIRDASAELGDGPVRYDSYFWQPLELSDAGLPVDNRRYPFAAAQAPMMLRAGTNALFLDQNHGMVPPLMALEEAVQAPPLLAPPTREDFPELAYLELFEFTGHAERVIPLGDQIGTWRCRAYLVSGVDLLELTADVQAEKPLYAELDLPAIVAAGDEVEASVTYHSDGPAEMTLTLPDGEAIQGVVMGHGSERFKLTGPGEIAVQLSGKAGQDWTTRTVQAPGVQTVTASRLELLRAGETVSGERVIVYPGVNLVLTDTIEALLCYPFG